METNATDNMMMDKGKEKKGDELYLVKRPRVFLLNAHLTPISSVISSPPPQLAHPPTPWQPPPAAQSHVSTTTQPQRSSLSSSSTTTTIPTITNRIESSSPPPPQSLPPPPPPPPQSMHSISSILSPQPTTSSPPRSVSDPSTASSSSSQGSTSPAGGVTSTNGTSNNPSTTMQTTMGGPKVEIMYQDGRMVPSSRPKRMRRGPVEPKMRRVQPLEKDPVSGEYKLPARVGILTVHSLGRVVPLPTYHNDRYIWPPGFKVSRYVYMYMQ